MGNIGNFTANIALSVVYFGLIPLITVPVRFFSDPFRLKRKTKMEWLERESKPDMDWMSKQG